MGAGVQTWALARTSTTPPSSSPFTSTDTSSRRRPTVVLSLFLGTNPSLVHGRRVLELGCGTGLVSIVAAHAGASHVVATDGDDQVVHLAQHNIDSNHVGAVCHGAQHLWGQDMESLGRFDVVLGADIIACPYEQAYDGLLASLRVFLEGDAIALIAYKPRHGSEVKFFHKLKREFAYTVVPADETHVDFRHLGIQLLRIMRRNT
ncbi:Aste57867_19218 [Aphanomyces stellatus]|uniref:Aste57867_19218 protein n=1 Tax=Aphanomyces stellatus TaxID=120398 RepID=A0A485LC10_9STRA|nr:hypothetical protein As57867_019154 [Aphanomyces stellatus]VFT95939.1 Aste57867_19218 [Aphanomyces stellatus]